MQLLGALPDGSPLTAFLPEIGGAEPGRTLRRRAALSSTLVASLELARAGALALDQDAPWMPIRVQHGDGHHYRLDRLMARDRIGSTGGNGVAFGLRNHVIAAAGAASDKPPFRPSGRLRGTRDHRECTDRQTGPDWNLKSLPWHGDYCPRSRGGVAACP
jgi:hypothetical protein